MCSTLSKQRMMLAGDVFMVHRVVDPDTKRVAQNMFNRKQINNVGYTLILGAGASVSSGCPSFYNLCADYCSGYGLEVKNGDPIFTAKEYIRTTATNAIDDYSWFSKHLKNRKPSIGYNHLVNLIKQGYFTTVVTTNYDCLLENALIKHMGLDDVKIMIRGEIADDTISDLLKREFPMVRIVKMHGDLSSGVFFITDRQTSLPSPKLTGTLGDCFNRGLVIVGSSMNDSGLSHILLSAKCESVVYVNHTNPTKVPGIMSKLRSLNDKDPQIISGDSGDFDRFFTDLDIEVQNHYVTSDAIKSKLEKIERNIIEEQEKGSGYINYGNLSDLLDNYVTKINKFKPDCLIFINDPEAPGGMELKRRLQKKICCQKICTILVAGAESRSRQHGRAVKSSKDDFSVITDDVNKILVLDAIAFSGNTMNLALEKLNEWFKCKTIRPGVLFLDKTLHSTAQKSVNHFLSKVIYEKLTDRHEMFFPWGIIQTTDICSRTFSGIEEYDKYCVKITRTPWGNIELLADEKYCSVRILTIEADCKYSLQRHLCRDEFFISLDDNISLELCGKNLSEDKFEKYSSYYDEPNINSLVLEKGDYILIPRGMWHRFRASKERVRLLEIGYGIYDEAADIKRIEDPYGRDKTSEKS